MTPSFWNEKDSIDNGKGLVIYKLQVAQSSLFAPSDLQVRLSLFDVNDITATSDVFRTRSECSYVEHAWYSTFIILIWWVIFEL